MHDKYQDIKRKKKEEQGEIKPTAKWKKRGEDSPTTPEPTSERKHNASEGESEHRKQIMLQFERDWQDEMGVDDELLTSKLLDSLDLDMGTLNRQLEIKQLTKQKAQFKPAQPKDKPEEVLQLRDIIGY